MGWGVLTLTLVGGVGLCSPLRGSFPGWIEDDYKGERGLTSNLQTKFQDPCANNATDKTGTLYVCYQNTTVVAVLTVPLWNIRIGGYAGREWDGYVWYMSWSYAKQQNRQSGWGHVFTTTSSATDWKGTYGWEKESRNWTKRVILDKDVKNLIITVNTTVMPFEKPPNQSEGVALKNPPCHVLALCIYRPHANDPCLPFGICPNLTATTSIAETNTPTLTQGKRTVEGEVANVSMTIMDNPSVDEFYRLVTGVSKQSNNWMLMAEQAASAVKEDCVVCMGPRPLLKIVPSPLNTTCLVLVMTKDNPGRPCNEWDEVFPLTDADKHKPLFSKLVAPGNFTCVNFTGRGVSLGIANGTWCKTVVQLNDTLGVKSRSDIWWWCGNNKIYDRLPRNHTGVCALVTLILPVDIFSVTAEVLSDPVLGQGLRLVSRGRHKRDLGWDKDDPTYIDSIGVPRGVPDEYKLANQVAAGFESAVCWWCTINKNVDRINYVHYNVQRLGNRTQEGFTAVHEQLSATSLMAFQNRIAIDMMLAEKGGVCAIFGESCCTFIPNNTAADGSLTRALEGLRSLNNKMKDHSGVDTSVGDSWGEVFGKYKALVTSVLVSLAVFTSIMTLCGCCCIPCIRALCTRLITTAIQPVETKVQQMYALLPKDDIRDYERHTDSDSDDDDPHLPDLFPDPESENESPL